MAHNKNLNFYIKPTETCGNIELQEEIDFDSIGYERDEIALALFYKTTDDTDWNCDITNDTNNPIVLTLEYSGLYEFNLFAVLVWTDPTTVVDDGIVYYEGYYWKNVFGDSLSTAPVEGSDWEKLDCDSYADFLAFAEATDNDPFTGGYYTSLYDYSCVKASYTRIGCNEFRITTTETSGKILIKLYDYAKTEPPINTYYIDIDANETYVDIDLDADGVYLIEMGLADETDETLFSTDIDPTEEILMAYCNIETCWASLTGELLCRPINVCCQSCDADALEALEKKRYTLNAMTNLWFKLIAYIQVEQGQYYQMSRVYEQNGSAISVDRVNYLKQVEDTITRLGEIVSACGDCENDDIVTDNCRNC